MSSKLKLKGNSSKVELKSKSLESSNKTLPKKKSGGILTVLIIIGILVACGAVYYKVIYVNKKNSSLVTEKVSNPSTKPSVAKQEIVHPSSVASAIATCDKNDKECIAAAVAAATSADAVIPKSANIDGKPREAVKDCIDRYPTECKDFAKTGKTLHNMPPSSFTSDYAYRSMSIVSGLEYD